MSEYETSCLALLERIADSLDRIGKWPADKEEKEEAQARRMREMTSRRR
jgi:hypothetical protein